MPPLTTHLRVAHRLGFSDKDVASEDMEEFIEDAQALIEAMAERIFAITDSDYTLARSACTDLAAAYSLIRVLGGAYSGLQFSEDELNISAQQQSKLELANKLLARANKAIDILKSQQKVSLIAKCSTA